MKRAARQRGVALFTVVFLIVAVGGLAVTVGLVSGQQQLTTVQTFEQTRAYYAARARLDREIAELLVPGGTCPATPGPGSDFNGFTTVLETCTPPPPSPSNVDEGGTSYTVFELEVRAFRGNAGSGTLVQRSIRVQVTSGP